MMPIKEILAKIAIICEGDFHKMIKLIKNKVRVPENDEVLNENYQCALKSNMITCLDPLYPDEFKKAVPSFVPYCPPIILFTYGNPELLKYKRKLGIISSSLECTDYEKQSTIDIIDDTVLNRNDTVVMANMRNGASKVALEEAMKKGSNIIVISQQGIDKCPKGYEDIYAYCHTDKGLIISEYPLDTPSRFVEPERGATSPDDEPSLDSRILPILSDTVLAINGRTDTDMSLESDIVSTLINIGTKIPRDVYALYPFDLKNKEESFTYTMLDAGLATPLMRSDKIREHFDKKYPVKEASRSNDSKDLER